MLRVFFWSAPRDIKKLVLSTVSTGVSTLLLSLVFIAANSTPINKFDIKTKVQYVELEPNSLVVEHKKANPIKIVIAPGDSLSLLLKRHGIGETTSHYLIKTEHGKKLSWLREGERLSLVVDKGRLKRLVYMPSALKTYHYKASGNQFKSELRELVADAIIQVKSFSIQNSLYESALASGLSDRLIIDTAKIFAWDIDFGMDIRQHDTFTVLYEGLYLNGEKVGNGDIVAAEFINRGRSHKAVLYSNTQGQQHYYDPDGNNLQKAFLRTPLDIFRISSHFNPKRKHPILNRIKAHKGIDYAAPKGTAVKASADGKIISVGTNNGYGKTIKIQHGHKYATLYAHLDRFHEGIRAGNTITQGQVIGYVGKTGLANGYHLHYEFLIDGVQHNPITVRYPQAKSITAEEKANFLVHSRPLLDLIDRASNYFAINRHTIK